MVNEIFKKNKEEITVILIFMFFAFAFNIYRVQSDGLLYYTFLEGMLRLSDPENSAGALKNPYFFQSGCAFLNAPFYLLAYGIEHLLQKSLNFNGITLRTISINIASNFYIALSLILMVRLLKKLNFKYRTIPVISVLFSTTAFAAATIIPSFNHAADIFINTLFICLFFEDGKDHQRNSFWLGLLYVVAILIRYLNFILIIPLIVYYFLSKQYRKIKYFFMGFFCIGWVIPLILYIYNGTASPLYHTAFFSMSFTWGNLIPKYFLKYLVHPVHGLFVWSPVTILSALGLLKLSKPKEKIGYFLLGIWLLLVFVYGYFNNWNGGWSFSNRYLVSLFPVYIIGLAALLENYGPKLIILVIVMTVYSIFLFFNWYLCVLEPEFDTPWGLVKAWMKGYSPTFVGGKVNLNTFLQRIYEVCRYKHIL